MYSSFFFHNPLCSKSRIALEYLNELKLKFKILFYLNDDMSIEFLSKVFSFYPYDRNHLLRLNDLNKDNYDLSSFSLINLCIFLKKYPKYIQRPIYFDGNKTLLGRPLDNLYVLNDN